MAPVSAPAEHGNSTCSTVSSIESFVVSGGRRRRTRRRDGAPRILGITLVDVLQKGVKATMYSFVDRLFMAVRAPLWSRRGILLRVASGNTTEPISRPSATSPAPGERRAGEAAGPPD